MALNEKLFFPKETVCPVCDQSFTRYALQKSRFSISKRDIDYRPLYLGSVNPRLFAVCVCPNCLYSGEDKFFCPKLTADEARRKQLFSSQKAQWEAQSRISAAASGQQIWKDMAADKLKSINPTELMILKRISPLLKKAAADVLAKGRPINELQKQGDWDAAVRGYELAAICYKARAANHRILGYTYLSGAWTARDAFEALTDEDKKAHFKDIERAFLREALNFLLITNKATSIEDAYAPDGSKIVKENMPQSRIFEVMYILAGVNYLLGNQQDCLKFLEQIIFGGGGAQGIMLWFVQQARDMRQLVNEDQQRERDEADDEAAPPPPDDAAT